MSRYAYKAIPFRFISSRATQTPPQPRTNPRTYHPPLDTLQRPYYADVHNIYAQDLSKHWAIQILLPLLANTHIYWNVYSELMRYL